MYTTDLSLSLSLSLFLSLSLSHTHTHTHNLFLTVYFSSLLCKTIIVMPLSKIILLFIVLIFCGPFGFGDFVCFLYIILIAYFQLAIFFKGKCYDDHAMYSVLSTMALYQKNFGCCIASRCY